MQQAIWGTGKRKTAIARVRVLEGSGKIIVNGKPVEEYFPVETQRVKIYEPLNLTNMNNKLDIFVNVAGGGMSGQIDATRHGISRALLKYNEELKAVLKKADLLTRDSRIKERKKYGLHGARKATQYRKR